MPIGNAPQFRGVSDTLDAYHNAGISAFAVCYAKDINFRYTGDDIDEGRELLNAWLTKLKEHGTQAIYQLRLYEDLNGKSIKSNTPYDMAFKFVLNERDGSFLPVKPDGGVSNTDLMNLLSQMADLKAENAVLHLKLESQEEEEEEEEKPQRPADKKSMGEILLEKFTPALSAIGERIADIIVPPATPAKVSGIVIETGNVDEEKLIEQSIRRLKSSVPESPGVAVVLMKLADLSEKQPGQFMFYMNTLIRMKL